MKKILMTIFLSIFLIGLASAVTEGHGLGLTTPGAVGSGQESGVRIFANHTIDITRIAFSPLMTADTLNIRNDSSTLLATASISGGLSFINFTLEQGKFYKIVATKAGSWTHYCNGTQGLNLLPVQTPSIAWVNGTLDNVNSLEIYFCNIENITFNRTSTQLVSPANNSSSSSNPINLTANSSALPALFNISYYIWQENTIINSSTQSISGTNNWSNSLLSVPNPNVGSYKWNALTCNDESICKWGSSNFTFSLGVLIINNSYNTSTYETASENFITNISITSGQSIQSANLYIDGTPYSSTINNYIGNNWTLSKQLDIPLGIINSNWFWSINFAGGNQTNLSSNSQTVSTINFTSCVGAPQNIRYINFTFKNETAAQESVNATFQSSWSYWLGSGTVNKSYSFTNLGANPSYAFCFSPQNRIVYAQHSIVYANSYSSQRTYTPSFLSLTNTTTNSILYLLPTSSGQSVSFQVKTVSGDTIPSAVVNITRSGYGLIESKLTDSSGVATFFLDPIASYVVTTFKQGYPMSIESITPSLTEYTITLGSTGVTNLTYDFSQGINYRTYPSLIELNNDTSYTFSFVISSSFWSLDSYGFNLTDPNGNILATASGSNNAGSNVSTIYVTTNNTFITMNYYWYIDGNYTSGTRVWIVTDLSGSGYSIKNFVDNLKRYLNSSSDSDGLFGLTINTSSGNFSLAIFIFLIIFCFAGVMSFKYGLSSPSAIAFIIFSAVLFFDVGIGLMPTIMGIPHFVTLFMAIAVVALFLREAT